MLNLSLIIYTVGRLLLLPQNHLLHANWPMWCSLGLICLSRLCLPSQLTDYFQLMCVNPALNVLKKSTSLGLNLLLIIRTLRKHIQKNIDYNSLLKTKGLNRSVFDIYIVWCYEYLLNIVKKWSSTSVVVNQVADFTLKMIFVNPIFSDWIFHVITRNNLYPKYIYFILWKF